MSQRRSQKSGPGTPHVREVGRPQPWHQPRTLMGMTQEMVENQSSMRPLGQGEPQVKEKQPCCLLLGGQGRQQQITGLWVGSQEVT
jgi:hypothetical protein